MGGPIELPDWVRGTLLLGSGPGGVIVPILVDATGQINVLTRGVDALGTVRTVRVDNVGQLYAILRGAGGNDVAVDAVGNLAAILKGIDGLGNLHTIFVDAAGQVVMVPRGNTGNYMAIDASGFMTAVLKGEYSGALHTIAVDANGRIEAFLMDGADQWGKTLRIGNAELAARLNLLRTYDWRGDNLYEWDMSNGAPSGTLSLSGLGASGGNDPAYWRTGGYSYRLTGGSNASQLANWEFIQANPPSPRIGVQQAFSVTASGTFYRCLITIDYLTNRRIFGIQLDTTAKQLAYWNNVGAWVNFQAVDFVAVPAMFYHMKLVVDASTGKYMRALYDNAEFDMSTLVCQTQPTGSWPYIDINFQMISRAGFNDSAYLDSFVITTNEPV